MAVLPCEGTYFLLHESPEKIKRDHCKAPSLVAMVLKYFSRAIPSLYGILFKRSSRVCNLCIFMKKSGKKKGASRGVCKNCCACCSGSSRSCAMAPKRKK